MDEELIGTQFSLEQEEEEEEKDEVRRIQCCGSGMFIPVRNFSIPDPWSKDSGSGFLSKFQTKKNPLESHKKMGRKFTPSSRENMHKL